MIRDIKLPVIFLAIILLITNTAFAGGLSSHFIEVKLKGLIPGKTYSVKEMTKRPVDITNTTEDITVDIAVEAERPVDYNLVPGYEPIPDLSWVLVEKNYFTGVKPKESVETDVLISVPEDKEYTGKKYQVYIYSHTAGKETFRMGLMGRVLIETEALSIKQ